MHKKYELVGPRRETDYLPDGQEKPMNFDIFELFEHDDGGLFGEGRRESPTATIHVAAEAAYIIAPSVPQGIRANDLEHAVLFCRSMLGITQLISADK